MARSCLDNGNVSGGCGRRCASTAPRSPTPPGRGCRWAGRSSRGSAAGPTCARPAPAPTCARSSRGCTTGTPLGSAPPTEPDLDLSWRVRPVCLPPPRLGSNLADPRREAGMAKDSDKDLPGTLQRSPTKARRTYRKAHDSAVETYGEGERAHRTAFSAVKHSFEKKGDHWEPKKRKGPSDPQAAKTYTGVDAVGNTKEELYERAKKLGVKGRSRMSKAELAEAIGKKQ